jgi:ankyrin repeat protein
MNELVKAQEGTSVKKVVLTALLVAVAIALSGCIATMKALHLATFNEVLIGVMKNDPNKVREAAREGVVFDDGDKAIDSSNLCGERPLHLATQKGNLEIVEILLQEGADPELPSELPRSTSLCEDQRMPSGYPSLHYAIWDGKSRIAEAILFSGANPKAKTSDGKGALALAEGKQGFELVTAYLASPAHLAARTGDIGSLRATIDAGAGPNSIMSATGRSVLDEALLASQYFVVDYLLVNEGAVSGLRSPEVAQAIDEYALQNPGSAYAEQLQELMEVE